MIKVLFVCLGNICRSPMAEALFKHKVKQLNVADKFIIESRATSSYEIGNPPHPGTIKILNGLGITTYGMKSERIGITDFNDFDYIIGMDQYNIRDLKQMSDSKHHFKMMKLIDIDIPDPYYTLDFNETYELIEKGLKRFLDKLEKEGKL